MTVFSLLAVQVVWSSGVEAGVRLGEVQVIDLGVPAAGEAVVVSPDGAHVYVDANQSVSAFTRDVGSGELTFVQKLSLSLAPGCVVADLAVSPDGLHLYAACKSGLSDLSGIRAMGRNPSTGELTLIQGLDLADGLSGRSGVAISSDGGHVYAGDTILTRNSTTGELTVSSAVPGIPQHRRLSPDGLHLYAGSESTIKVFARDSLTGSLSLLQEIDVETESSVHPVSGVALSSDGAQVYFSVTNVDLPSMHVYRRDSGTGTLALTQLIRPNVEAGDVGSLRLPAVSPDGRAVYATKGLNLKVFGRGSSTGRISFGDTSGTVTVGGAAMFPRPVAVTPDSRHIYVGASSSSPVTSALLVFAPLPSACPSAPALDCREQTEPGTGRLKIQDKSPDSRDQVKWTWAKGEETPEAALGDPAFGGTEYVFCTYDGSQELVFSATPATGPDFCSDGQRCWKDLRSGYSYKDSHRTLDGIATIRLKPGDVGKAKLKIKAQRLNLDPPALPLTLPVIAQLHASNGECWESRYSTFVKKNDGVQFNARAGSASGAFLEKGDNLLD